MDDGRGDLCAGRDGEPGRPSQRCSAHQLFHWRKLAAQGALTATSADGEVVAASEYRALPNQVRELNEPDEAFAKRQEAADAEWAERKAHAERLREPLEPKEDFQRRQAEAMSKNKRRRAEATSSFSFRKAEAKAASSEPARRTRLTLRAGHARGSASTEARMKATRPLSFASGMRSTDSRDRATRSGTRARRPSQRSKSMRWAWTPIRATASYRSRSTQAQS